MISPHATQRLHERYGLVLSPADERAIAERARAMVRDGIAIRQSHTRSLCPIEWQGVILYAVWSKRLKRVVTFLPQDVARLEEVA